MRIDDCAVLAAVGQNMCQTPGVSAQLFEALASANCNVKAISQAGGSLRTSTRPSLNPPSESVRLCEHSPSR